MLSSEMIFVTLRYGENLEEVQLKSLGSWFKKNKQKIECTIKTATAVSYITANSNDTNKIACSTRPNVAFIAAVLLSACSTAPVDCRA